MTTRKASSQAAFDTEPDFTALMVDDNEGFLETTGEILASDNIEVLYSTSVEEAIKLLQANSRIAVILTDLEMPERNGSELLKYLRSNLRFGDIPILVVSSHSSRRWLATVLALGAVDYLVKPVPADMLVARVRRAVEQATGCILLVTGDPLVNDVLSKTIRRAGFRLFAAGLGKDAVKMLSAQRMNVVIADLSLADMTGMDLLVEIKENYPTVPVILIARKHTNVRAEDLVAAGGDGIIRMPFCNMEIITQVRGLLRTKPAALTAKTQIIRDMLNLQK